MLNQPIFCFVVGRGKDGIMFQAGMHAREYIGSVYLLREIELLKCMRLDHTYYIVPIANPDGVKIALDGIEWIRDKSTHKLLDKICTSHKLYKANARGVDLNVNFDADWGKGKGNMMFPCSHGYIGGCSMSEPENKALIRLILSKNIKSVISYHAKGEVVYFGFKMSKIASKNFQKSIQRVIIDNDYKIIRSIGSCGGLSDYCVQEGIYAFTVEVGRDNLSHPLPLTETNKVMRDNAMLPLRLSKERYGQ